MERIAPLAKILAEANGIDWQKLHGSGDGGMIVEQDILNYLSRIMSGEEEPPSTPVDLPPPDWTGDMNAMPALPGAMNAELLSQAGVESDIADFVAQSRAEGAAPPSPVVPQAPEQSSLQEHPEHIDEFELDEEPAAPTPLVAPEPVAAEPVAAELEPTPPAPEVVPPAAAAASVTAAGLGSLLSRLYHKPSEPAHAEPTPETTPEPVVTPAPAPMPEPVPAAAPIHAEPAAEPVRPEAVQPEPVHVQPAPVPPVPEQPVPEQPVPVQPVPMPSEPVPSEPAQPAPAAPAPQPMPAVAAQGSDAVWFGAYLRRDAEVGAALDLQGQLGRALGQDVSLAFLVARAAQRHAAALNLHTVALGDAAQAHPVQATPLREALAALAEGHHGTPDLLVVDAGAHGLDDLHYPHTTTLSVGRVQGGRAALTLNGPVDAAQAARFLADVAGTLEQPILLVL